VASGETPWSDASSRLLDLVSFYEGRIGTVRTAKEAMRILAKDIDTDGLHQAADAQFYAEEPP
jgi:hypothetical protein